MNTKASLLLGPWEVNKHSSKEDRQVVNKHVNKGRQQTREQRPNSMSQHYNEIPSYPKQVSPKRQEQPIREKMWKKCKVLYIVGRDVSH